MRRLILASAVLALSAVVFLRAQARPDFSGTWEIDLTMPRPALPPATAGASPAQAIPPGAPPPAPAPSRGAAPPPSPNPTEPIRVGGMVDEPRKTVHVDPIYPPDAIKAGIQGVVILEATIATDGTVKQAKVLRPFPPLTESAVEAVMKWKYTPTLLNGVPVEVLMTVAVSFSLKGTAPAAGAGIAGPLVERPVAGRVGTPPASTSQTITIVQDKDTLKITPFNSTQQLVYRLDGTPSVNGPVTYTSRWEGASLVTTIATPGDHSPPVLTQTLSRDGEKLVIEYANPNAPGRPRFVYVRKK